MDSNAIIKVEPDDPRRCQAVTGIGQCRNLADNEFKLCPIHISAHNRTLKNRQINMYDLTKWRAKVQGFADHDDISSLRQEIGVTRLVLERLIEQCQTEADLIIYSNKITELVKTIKTLVQDCHRLDKSRGSLLDKTTILKIAGDIIDIVTEEIDDPGVLEKISGKILEKIAKASPIEDLENS